MKYTFLAILFLSLFMTIGFSASVNSSQGIIEPPDTLEGLKTMVLKVFLPFEQGFKQALEQAKIIWNKLYIEVRGWWTDNLADKVSVWLNRAWQWLKGLFIGRESVFKQEFNKEKEEMKKDVKTEIPKLQKTFWEKFKEIIK